MRTWNSLEEWEAFQKKWYYKYWLKWESIKRPYYKLQRWIELKRLKLYCVEICWQESEHFRLSWYIIRARNKADATLIADVTFARSKNTTYRFVSLMNIIDGQFGNVVGLEEEGIYCADNVCMRYKDLIVRNRGRP